MVDWIHTCNWSRLSSIIHASLGTIKSLGCDTVGFDIGKYLSCDRLNSPTPHSQVCDARGTSNPFSKKWKKKIAWNKIHIQHYASVYGRTGLCENEHIEVKCVHLNFTTWKKITGFVAPCRRKNSELHLKKIWPVYGFFWSVVKVIYLLMVQTRFRGCC